MAQETKGAINNMTKQNNKTCITCGKKYTYCNRCDDYATLPKWKTIWCSERCKEIFNTASYFLSGSIDAEEAKKRLSGFNLNKNEEFSFGVQKALDKLVYFEPFQEESNILDEEITFSEEQTEMPVKVQVKPRKKKDYSEQ